MKCEDCEIDYPNDLVSTFSSTEGYARLCGICALVRTNIIHGTKRTHFNGEIAESLRRRAIAFRKRQHA